MKVKQPVSAEQLGQFLFLPSGVYSTTDPAHADAKAKIKELVGSGNDSLKNEFSKEERFRLSELKTSLEAKYSKDRLVILELMLESRAAVDNLIAKMAQDIIEGKNVVIPIQRKGTNTWNTAYEGSEAEFSLSEASPLVGKQSDSSSSSSSSNKLVKFHEYRLAKDPDVHAYLEKQLDALYAGLKELKSNKDTSTNLTIINKLPKTAQDLFKEAFTPQAQTVATVKSIDKIWEKIEGQGFLSRFTKYSPKVQPDKTAATLTVGEDATKSQLTVSKQNDQLQVKNDNPNETSIDVMVDLMAYALKPGAKVIIQFKPKEGASSEEIDKLKNQAWLSAMTKGFEVTNYSPDKSEFKDLLAKGIKAKEDYSKSLIPAEAEREEVDVPNPPPSGAGL